MCLCFGSTGPLYAGYMLAGGYSWRLFFYVEFAFAVALLIFAFLVVEETTYHRKLPQDSQSEGEKPGDSTAERVSDIPPRKTFVQTLKFWGVWEKDSDFFLMMVRSFTYYLVPQVFWVVTTYGMPLSPSLSFIIFLFFPTLHLKSLLLTDVITV